MSMVFYISADEVPAYMQAYDRARKSIQSNHSVTFSTLPNMDNWMMDISVDDIHYTKLFLEICSGIYMELPGDFELAEQSVEPVEWDHSDPIGTGPGEEELGEPSEDFLGVSDGPVEDDDFDTTESATEPDGTKKLVLLKKPKIVQKSGSISVEED